MHNGSRCRRVRDWGWDRIWVRGWRRRRCRLRRKWLRFPPLCACPRAMRRGHHRRWRLKESELLLQTHRALQYDER